MYILAVNMHLKIVSIYFIQYLWGRFYIRKKTVSQITINTFGQTCTCQ
jgi:hypothetical protein